MLVPVAPEYIPSVWPEARPAIARFFQDYSSYTVDQLEQNILSGSCKILVDVEQDRIKFVVIYSLVQKADGELCFQILNTGSPEGTSEDELDFPQYVKNLESIAKLLGCKYIEAIARVGLSQYFPKYIERGRILIKRL